MIKPLTRRFVSNKGYGIYLFTMVLSIIIFYIFNALSDATMLDLLSTSSGDYVIYVELMALLMHALSVVVMIIFVVLIVYGGAFMFKRRSKEFALLLLNGIAYKALLKQLIQEVGVMTIIALSIGLTIGIGLSQLINILVVAGFGVDVNLLGFTISWSALGYTVVLTITMMVISLFIQYRMIKKVRLVSLLQYRLRVVHTHLSFGFSLVITVVSTILLVVAYRLIFDIRFLSHDISILLIPICLGIISTYGLFKAVPIVIVTLLKHIPSVHYGIHFYPLKSILVNISAQAAMYALVCITLFLSLSFFGVAMGLRSSYIDTLDQAMPFDMTIKRYGDDQYMVQPVDEVLVENGYDLNQLRSYESIIIYDDAQMTYGNLLKDQIESYRAQYPNFDFDTEADIVTLDDYNRIMQASGYPLLDIPVNSYAIALDEQAYGLYGDMVETMLDENGSLTIGQTILIKGDDTIVEHGYSTISNGTTIQLIVNMDEASLHPYASYMVANYKDGSNQDAPLSHALANGPYTRMDSRLGTLNSAAMLGIVMAFVGLYIGVALTLTCGALVALKQLSDALDEKTSIDHIYRIGYGLTTCMRITTIKTMIAFSAPLVLSLVHTSVGLNFVSFITNGILMNGNGSVYGFTMLILCIYLIYFAITIHRKRSIVSGYLS